MTAARDHRVPAPFLVSAGRSGTTLLRLMLDAHPQLAIPPETDFIPAAVRACRFSHRPALTFIATVTEHWRFTDLHIDPEELARRVQSLSRFSVADGLRLLYELYAEKFDKHRWGDKTPHYVREIPVIARVLPEARFVHVIRDGRDVALSIRPLWFGADTLERAAGDWRKSVRAGRRGGRRMGRYLEVRYEDLVERTEPTLRAVCAFLDLPWHDDVLRAHERAAGRIAELTEEVRDTRGELVASLEQRHAIHRLTSEPPRADRAGRWRREMSHAENRAFERIAGDLLAELGYETRRRGRPVR